MEEEVKKNSSLSSKLNEVEQQNVDMKREMMETKQTLENMTKEMDQRKNSRDQRDHGQRSGTGHTKTHRQT